MKINTRIILPNLAFLLLVVGTLLLVTFKLYSESKILEREALATSKANQLTLRLNVLHKRQSDNILDYSYTRNDTGLTKGTEINDLIESTIDVLKETVSEIRGARILRRYMIANNGNTRIGRELIKAIRENDQRAKRTVFLRWGLKGRLVNATLSDLTAYNRGILERTIARNTSLTSYLTQLTFAAALIAIIFFCFAFFYYRRTIVNPIIQFKKAVDGIASGRLDATVEDKIVKVGGEIGALASAFNAMSMDLQSTTVSRDVLVNEVKSRKFTQKKLEQSNKELDDFAYIVSHDLKAPLRAIRSLVDIIVDEYQKKIDDEGTELLTLLKNRSERMNNLIIGILEYSRLGKASAKKEYLQMDQLLADVIESIRPSNDFQISLTGNMSSIYANRIQIIQVFQNLLSNSIKFMDKIPGVLVISCEDFGEYCQYAVRDNGPGIAREYFEKIFKIFQTLNPRDEIESTGVGLSITRKIVEMHGGSIWLDSVPGDGTTFFVTFYKHDHGGHIDEH